MTKITTDIDIDVVDRNALLQILPHIPASIKKESVLTKHNSGVYLSNIPHDPATGLAAINYKEAEDRGYFKLDFLNNSVYAQVRDEAHLVELMELEPIWDLFCVEEVVKQLAHLHQHFAVVSALKPQSVEQLAATLAIIRPAKRYLIGKSWNEILREVWLKPDTDEYYFKKAHGIAYAVSIIVQLNLFCEQVVSNAALSSSA